MKYCRTCSTEKQLSEFNNRKSSADGLTPNCKDCARASMKIWYEKNKSKRSEYNKLWNINNKEKRYALTRKWKKENPEKISRAGKLRYDSCREEIIKAVKAYGAENPEKLSAHSRNRRSRKRNAEGTHAAADILRIFDHQRGLCANCHSRLFKSGAKKYHADHIVPLARGGSNWPSNLQCLCPSCNLSKHAKDPIDWAKEQGRLI